MAEHFTLGFELEDGTASNIETDGVFIGTSMLLDILRTVEPEKTRDLLEDQLEELDGDQ